MLVKSRMSKYPLTIGPEESLSDAHKYMDEQKVRHLPVVKSDGKMVGLIQCDLIECVGDSLSADGS
jgi:CBS domain-containing protein